MEANKQVQAIQKAMREMQQQKEKLLTQLNENEQVVKELDLLETRAEVMKLVGPVMVKQNAEEAKSNVEKRVEFIKGEVAKIDAKMKQVQDDFFKQQEALAAAQQKQQQQQQQQAK
eukprot:TRINITY_DN1325_c0_g1_i1.p1 TRINITY_DN1325_c0_g1~~TRINITY_DN1325_c0_g1_i1.p1  ORF type:complete len:116 (-),score=43.46 TRINITY_DN1325_c0_g1_i1:129-476(-)